MTQYTYEQLKGMTVAQLREIAQGIEHEELKGFSTMHKDHLLPALCKALGIDAHAHHVAAGEGKTEIKARIRQLKAQRAAALESKDAAQCDTLRRHIHTLKHKLRRMAT